MYRLGESSPFSFVALMPLTMPAVTTPRWPQGLPIAKTHSPTRNFDESPTDAACRLSAAIRSMARSCFGWRSITFASSKRSSDRCTWIVDLSVGTTWWFVITYPSALQMIPVPIPRPSLRTWTMLACTFLMTCMSACEKASGSRDDVDGEKIVSCAMFLSLLSLTYRDLHCLECVTTNDVNRYRLANTVVGKQRLQVFRIGDRLTIESYQDIAEHQTAFLGRAIIIHYDDEQAVLLRASSALYGG